jgi:hypothetical protein
MAHNSLPASHSCFSPGAAFGGEKFSFDSFLFQKKRMTAPSYFSIFLHALASSSRVLHGSIWQSMAMVWMLRT